MQNWKVFSFKQPSILQEIDNYSKLLNMSLKQDISGHKSLGCTFADVIIEHPAGGEVICGGIIFNK